MDWYRRYNGTSSDPKFRMIAKKAGAHLCFTLSFWDLMLEYANQSKERGSIEGFNIELAAFTLDIEEEVAHAIYEQMQAIGLHDGESITAWDRRQVKRERDDDSSERVKKHRENKRLKKAEESVTPCNASETHVTPCNAPEQNRTEQIREEKENQAKEKEAPPPTAPPGEYLNSGLDLNNLFDCVGVVCLLFGKRRLTGKEQETLAVWCDQYDMRKALPIVEAELNKFRLKNNKDPTSIAYFSPVLERATGIRLNGKKDKNAADLVKGLAEKMQV